MSNVKTLHLQWADGEIEAGTLIEALYEQEQTIAILRQHKNDYMDAAECTRKYLEAENAKLRAEMAAFKSAVNHVTADGKTTRSFSASEGWAMVHTDRLTDLHVAEDQLAGLRTGGEPCPACSGTGEGIDAGDRGDPSQVACMCSGLGRIGNPQPSAGVVMPERQSPGDEWHYVMRERSHGWNACLDEFARLNGKGGG